MASMVHVEARTPMLERVRAHAAAIREIVERHGATNPRVFGSVARGEERDGSDVDFVVRNVRLSLFDLVRLERELTEFLGVPVDVVTECEVPERARVSVIERAVPL